jgi:hypothetical protein
MSLPPDSLSYNDLGGTKLEYSAPVDTSTDRSATEVNTAFAATAAMTRTSIRCWLKFSINGAGAPTLVSWDASWKGGTITPPVITNEATGKFLVTLPATVLDEQAVSHSVNLNVAFASIAGATDAIFGDMFLNPKILTANTVRLWISDETLDASNAPNSVVSMFLI